MKSDVRVRYDYETDDNAHGLTFDGEGIRLFINVGPALANTTEVEFPADATAWARLKKLSEFLADAVAAHEKVRREELKKRHLR